MPVVGANPGFNNVRRKGKKVRICRLILGLVLFCPLAAAMAGQQPTALLRSLATAGSPADGLVEEYDGWWRQEVDQAVLARMARGIEEKILLEAGGRALTLDRERLWSHGRSTTWVGRDRKNGSEAVLTLGPDYFFGRVVRDGRVFVYRPDPVTREMIIEERDPVNAMDSPDDVLVPSPAADESVPAGGPLAPIVAADNPDQVTVIDVMVLYSNGILNAYGSVDLVNTRIQHLVDLANTGMANSRINARLRLVHTKQVEYSDDINDDDALNALTNNQGVFAGVEDLRTQYGADQVTLLRVYTGHHCGLAWKYQGNGDARHAYAVVRDGRVGHSYCSDTTYAHEVGHNLGCGHDRDHGDGLHSYSHGYQFEGNSGWHRTIMAYSCTNHDCPKVTYYSNPHVSHDGVATGVADAADNARTIEETRVSVAGYRAAVKPDLALSARDHDFGSLDVGQSPATVEIQLENHGGGTLVIGTISGPASPFARSVDHCSNQHLESGVSCSLTLSFSPTVPGTFSDTVSIPSNDPDEPLVTITLSGQGQSQDAWISLSPDSLRFSALAPGATQDLSLVVTNTGRGNLVIDEVAAAAADPLDPPFSLFTDSCTGVTLATDETCLLTVRYTPQDRGDPTEDTFSLPSNAVNSPLVTVPVTVHSFPWILFMPAILGAGQAP